MMPPEFERPRTKSPCWIITGPVEKKKKLTGWITDVILSLR